MRSPRRRRLVSQSRSGDSESGSTLVTVIVAASILLIAIVIIMNATNDRLRTTWRIKSADSISEVEDNIRLRIQEVMGDFIEESLCGGDKAFSSVDWSAVGTDYNVSWMTPGEVFATLDYTGGPSHQAARSRCSAQQSFSSGTESFLNKNSIYFCLKMNLNAGAKETDLFKRGTVFSEVSINFIDIADGTTKTCETLLDPDDGIQAIYTRGMKVFYSLYWRGGPETMTTYQATNGVVHSKMHY